MYKTVRHFDLLVSQGLQVIPLWKNTKIPMLDEWTKRRWEQAAMRRRLERSPDANLGLLLGDIIDVEGDSPEANAIVTRLIGDYPHPCYKSTKSIHHLFLTPDPTLRRVVFQDIEFRGFGHQSVLPPSVIDDVRYQWLDNFKFPVPPMPDRLLSFYRKITTKKSRLKPGHMKIACATCRESQFLHKKRFNLELMAFKERQLRWSCQECRTIDLRAACRRLRNMKNTQGLLI